MLSTIESNKALIDDEERAGYDDFKHDEIIKPATPKPTQWEMTKHFARLAGPSVITNIFSYLVMTVNTIFAG